MSAAIRSWLFVPGDSPRKFERASTGTADALIIDLEDSVAPAGKLAARATTRAMLEAPRGAQQRWVRVNALDSNHTLADLAAVMPARPDGIVLPKCARAQDLLTLSLYLDAFEAAAGTPAGFTRIVLIATETAASLFHLDDYVGVTPRLAGLMWGAEDLSAALGARRNRVDGRYEGAFRLARDLCLAGSAAAGVDAIDTVYVDIDNLEGLREETLAARMDGFASKALIHPKHVDVVNEAFTPSAGEVDWARRVVAAFEAEGASGVARLDGKMIDMPHLKNAHKTLEAAQGGRAR